MWCNNQLLFSDNADEHVCKFAVLEVGLCVLDTISAIDFRNDDFHFYLLHAPTCLMRFRFCDLIIHHSMSQKQDKNGI